MARLQASFNGAGATARTCLLVPVLAMALTLGPSPPAASAHTFTYTVERRGATGDLDVFARVADVTLRHNYGWALGGAVDFRRVRSGGSFRLVLASPDAVAAASPGCSRRWSCRVGDQVLINERRWNHATSTWRRPPLVAYRKYVINHEVGHWLGIGHWLCTYGGRAPVMMQQSKGVGDCHIYVWPFPGERQQVARIHGIDFDGL